jgi:hypothetical protein
LELRCSKGFEADREGPDVDIPPGRLSRDDATIK